MKALVVYDSVFGNTAQVARAMAAALEGAAAKQVGEVTAEDLAGLDVLLVGSPTRAFRATPAMSAWLKGLSAGRLVGVQVAAFDTRADVEQIKNRFLSFMVKLFGYAAPRLSKGLVRKGGALALPPEGFVVLGTEGPLKEGELERAAAWARRAAGVAPLSRA